MHSSVCVCTKHIFDRIILNEPKCVAFQRVSIREIDVCTKTNIYFNCVQTLMSTEIMTHL